MLKSTTKRVANSAKHNNKTTHHKTKHNITTKRNTTKKRNKKITTSPHNILTKSSYHFSTQDSSQQSLSNSFTSENPASIPMTSLRYQVVRIGQGIQRPTTLFTSVHHPNSNTTKPQLHPSHIPVYPEGTRSKNRIVLQHALLASKSYWLPFIRSLHTQFNQKESKITDPIDLYIPDLCHHGDTAGHNDPNAIPHFDNYLDQLSGDLYHFITEVVLTPDELNVITSSTSSSTPSTHTNLPNIAVMGHSLGARAAMLWNLHTHARLNQHRKGDSGDTNKIEITHAPLHLEQWLSSLPIISLDASPSTYHHDHQLLFTAMLGAQRGGDLTSRQHVKSGLLAISPELDDNTIAFAIQNNLSSMTIEQLNQDGDSKHGYDQGYIDSKVGANSNSDADKQHFWTSNVERLNVVEKQVHKWPLLTPTELSQMNEANGFTKLNPNTISKLRILVIGGDQSHRLTTQSNLDDLKHFFPNYKLEMIRGGHFAHQGPDSNKAAGHIVEYLGNMWK